MGKVGIGMDEWTQSFVASFFFLFPVPFLHLARLEWSAEAEEP